MTNVIEVDYLYALDRAADLVARLGIEVEKEDPETARELSVVVVVLRTLHAQIERDRIPRKNRRLN